jgi:predicted 3-demethylubiquinone-9 3-methyltransferase (glyoxalase superfamily)
MATITPFLWFNGRIREAADFYASVFGADAVVETSGGPGDELMSATVEALGQRFIIFNGGPHYALTPAFSLFVLVEGQDEVDHYWDALLDGGEMSRCGWLVDRFGVSWQIVPTALPRLMGDPDRAKAQRVIDAMLGMQKLVVAELQAAYDAP